VQEYIEKSRDKSSGEICNDIKSLKINAKIDTEKLKVVEKSLFDEIDNDKKLNQEQKDELRDKVHKLFSSLDVSKESEALNKKFNDVADTITGAQRPPITFTIDDMEFQVEAQN
jgi:hypothetical protein